MRKFFAIMMLCYGDLTWTFLVARIFSMSASLNSILVIFLRAIRPKTSCSSPFNIFLDNELPGDESLKDFVEPLHLPDKGLVLFPINDNDDVSQAEGGSHWSLLAYERNSNVFVHHDSNRGMNKRHAKQLYDAVKGFMYDSDMASVAKFLECTDSPQQTNGYDCGLYVTAISRVICLWYSDGGNKDKDGGDLWLSAVKEQITPSVVAETRYKILGLIRGLMVMK